MLRPGGLFAFSGATPLSWVALDERTDTYGTTLERDWFGLHRMEPPDGMVEFVLPHGEWIALFRANGFTIERLVEVRPPEGADVHLPDARGDGVGAAFPDGADLGGAP